MTPVALCLERPLSSMSLRPSLLHEPQVWQGINHCWAKLGKSLGDSRCRKSSEGGLAMNAHDVVLTTES